VTLTDPELIKDVFNKPHDFGKIKMNPQLRLVAPGLVSHEGEKWSKHRKIINPAFNLEKLKVSFFLLDINLISSLIFLSKENIVICLHVSVFLFVSVGVQVS